MKREIQINAYVTGKMEHRRKILKKKFGKRKN